MCLYRTRPSPSANFAPRYMFLRPPPKLVPSARNTPPALTIRWQCNNLVAHWLIDGTPCAGYHARPPVLLVHYEAPSIRHWHSARQCVVLERGLASIHPDGEFILHTYAICEPVPSVNYSPSASVRTRNSAGLSSSFPSPRCDRTQLIPDTDAAARTARCDLPPVPSAAARGDLRRGRRARKRTAGRALAGSYKLTRSADGCGEPRIECLCPQDWDHVISRARSGRSSILHPLQGWHVGLAGLTEACSMHATASPPSMRKKRFMGVECEHASEPAFLPRTTEPANGFGCGTEPPKGKRVR